jgi:nucleotide-binding universal stress UspA family protein
MFTRVIIGVDGRPNGRDAIALGGQLADPDARTTLAHVYSGDLVGGAAESEERESSQRLLERERDDIVPGAELVSIGARSVGRGLHQLVEEQGADLLVVGSSHRSFAGRVMLGDDTRDSLNGASCAVAIAPLGYALEPREIATVGVGYDWSPESESALATARELAERFGAKLSALDVISLPTLAVAQPAPVAWGGVVDDLLVDANERLASLKDVEAEAVFGLPGEELAEYGDRVDLLVVGSRGYGPGKRLVMGSTSNHLAGHARSPLLVLSRAAAHEHPAPATAQSG